MHYSEGWIGRPSAAENGRVRRYFGEGGAVRGRRMEDQYKPVGDGGCERAKRALRKIPRYDYDVVVAAYAIHRRSRPLCDEGYEMDY